MRNITEEEEISTRRGVKRYILLVTQVGELYIRREVMSGLTSLIFFCSYRLKNPQNLKSVLVRREIINPIIRALS